MSDHSEDCLPCQGGQHGSCMDWNSAMLGVVCACKKRDHQEERVMKLFGEVDPTGGDGYIPGAWDEVRAAFLDGHISGEAYDVIRLHINPPPRSSEDERPPLTRPSSAFERPPGNVYVLPPGTILCETPSGCTCGAPADTPAGMHHCDCPVHPGWCGQPSCLPCERNGKVKPTEEKP